MTSPLLLVSLTLALCYAVVTADDRTKSQRGPGGPLSVWPGMEEGKEVVELSQHALPPFDRLFTLLRLTGQPRQTRFTHGTFQQRVADEDSPPSTTPEGGGSHSWHVGVAPVSPDVLSGQALPLPTIRHRRDTRGTKLPSQFTQSSSSSADHVAETDHNGSLVDAVLQDPSDNDGNLLLDNVAGITEVDVPSVFTDQHYKPASSRQHVIYTTNAEKFSDKSRVFGGAKDSRDSLVPHESLGAVDSVWSLLTEKMAKGGRISQSSVPAQDFTISSARTNSIMKKAIKHTSQMETPSSARTSSSSHNRMDLDIVNHVNQEDDLIMEARKMTQHPLSDEKSDVIENDVTGDLRNTVSTTSHLVTLPNNEPGTKEWNTEDANGQDENRTAISDWQPAASSTLPITLPSVSASLHTVPTVNTTTQPADSSTAENTPSVSSGIGHSDDPATPNPATTLGISESPNTTYAYGDNASQATDAMNTSVMTTSEKLNSVVTKTQTSGKSTSEIPNSVVTETQTSDESTSEKPNSVVTKTQNSDKRTSEIPSSVETKTQNSDNSSGQTRQTTTSSLPETKDGLSPSTANSAATSTAARAHTPPNNTSTAGFSSAPGDSTVLPPSVGDDNSSDDEDGDTFWPIVAALVIGIPSIIVFGIAILVIYRRRTLPSPSSRLRRPAASEDPV